MFFPLGNDFILEECSFLGKADEQMFSLILCSIRYLFFSLGIQERFQACISHVDK